MNAASTPYDPELMWWVWRMSVSVASPPLVVRREPAAIHSVDREYVTGGAAVASVVFRVHATPHLGTQ
jgi:hypothetical protein